MRSCASKSTASRPVTSPFTSAAAFSRAARNLPYSESTWEGVMS